MAFDKPKKSVAHEPVATITPTEVVKVEPAKVEPAASAASTSPESFEDKVAKMVATALTVNNEQMMKAMAQMGQTIGNSIAASMVASQMSAAKTEHDQRLEKLNKKLAVEEKCSVCRQAVGDGNNQGCGGPWARNDDGSFVIDPKTGTRVERPEQFHDKMVVFPNDPMASEFFPGLFINGVAYFSQGPQHKIWVPRKNDFASALSIFENNEREQRIGRKHRRTMGGSVSANGSRVVAPLGVGFDN